MKITVAVLAVVALAVLVVVGWRLSTGSEEPSSAPTTTPTITPPADQAVLLARLVIDDGVPPSGYSRDLFPTWLDLDGDGCDARDETLIIESVIPLDPTACTTVGGRWVSLYDGLVVTDPGQLDVDHLVPLADAWRSGAHGWTPTSEQRSQTTLPTATTSSP